MKWITRERPKVDRIACPWLIKRFVDPEAEFLYVPGDQVALEIGTRSRYSCQGCARSLMVVGRPKFALSARIGVPLSSRLRKLSTLLRPVGGRITVRAGPPRVC
jgi:hypothetical protein